jgi:hypothetical protein
MAFLGGTYASLAILTRFRNYRPHRGLELRQVQAVERRQRHPCRVEAERLGRDPRDQPRFQEEKPSVQLLPAKPDKTSLNPIRPFRRRVSSCSNSIHPWLKPSSIWMRGSGCFMPCDLKSCSHVWRGTASA